jgi:hypothetical protein
LLQPMNDDIWQAGDFSSVNYRRAGPSSECTGHSIPWPDFPTHRCCGNGYRSAGDCGHVVGPLFHPGYFRNSGEWESQAMEIRRQLDVYAQSLKEFEARYTPKRG